MSSLAETDPLQGRTLRGVYRIQEKIADGVMGAVYKAVHTALDAPFAVKVLRQELRPDAAVVARFQREARALSRLRHPNVVAVTDFGQTDDGTLFVVMEYVSGRSLARVIADEGPLPEHRVVRIGAQILAALADAHARQVLHGGLTPSDVLVEARRDPPDSVKVLDFGVAGIQLAGLEPPGENRAALAARAAAYLSPEQRDGGDVDARSDLYAVGAILYEMLTQALPFDPGGPGASRAAAPRRPSERSRRPVSPDLEALVLRALQPEPYERPESAADMREELLRCELAESTEDEDCGPTVVLPRSSDPAGERSASRPAPSPPPSPASVRATPARPSPPRSTPARGTPGTATARDPTPPRPRRSGAPARATPPEATARTATRGPPRRDDAQATPLPAAVLEDVERRALAILGPVARFLVAKAGAVATSAEELHEIVASFIPSEQDRSAFLAAAAPRRAAATTPARPRPAVAWDPAVLERAQRALAAHIGPVARVVVRRLSATARDPEHLHALLAREIGDEDGRAAFLRAVESSGHDSAR